MNTLKLTDVEQKLEFTINPPVTMHYLHKLVEHAYNIKLDFDVFLPTKNRNLQRDFCWSLLQKQQLIISVLKDLTLTPISIISYTDDSVADSNRETIYKVIDGKQRLSTLISFYNNEFPIEFNGNEYYYNDFDALAKRRIKFFQFNAYIVYEYKTDMISDDNKIKWFEYINFAGTPQDIEHLKQLKS